MLVIFLIALVVMFIPPLRDILFALIGLGLKIGFALVLVFIIQASMGNA